MLQRCNRRDSQDLAINSVIATDEQIRNHLIPYTSLSLQVLSANGIDSNFYSLRYAEICLPTFISRNWWEDLTSRWGLLFWCKAKFALEKSVSQHSCSRSNLNNQHRSLILPKLWANCCSKSNELLFLEKPRLENNIFRAVSDEKLTFANTSFYCITFKIGHL